MTDDVAGAAGVDAAGGEATGCDLRHPIDCSCDDGMFAVDRRGFLALVHWEDTTNVAEWQDRDEVMEFASNGGWLCENIGWVQVDDDSCIVLSARRSKTGHLGLTERIPKRSVLSVERLEAPAARSDQP